MEGFSWNSSNFSTPEYSWDQHPNFLTNNQNNNTYSSFSPPHQNWNDTFTNTFDQSREENYDYSCNFQRSDPCYGFTPFVTNYPSNFFYEQPEPSHSFETSFSSLKETITTYFEEFNSSLESLSNRIGQLVDESKNQNQGPLPSDDEKLNFVGKDESDIGKEIEFFKANFKHLDKPSLLPNREKDESDIEEELEIFEDTFKHMSKPSLFPNNEEVFQDAKISNLTNFAHVVQPSFCEDNSPKMVSPLTVGRSCVIKISEFFLGLCSLGSRLFTRNFGIIEVSIILKPLHFSKMYMWGGESHPT